MTFRYVIQVEVERDEGKFASRDELSEQIINELEGADPGRLDGDEGGMYSVVDWLVEESEIPRGFTEMVLSKKEVKAVQAMREERARTIKDALRKGS